MATGLDGRDRDSNGGVERKRGDVRVGTLRKKFENDFLSGTRNDARLFTVREESGMALTELVRQHRRGKK